MTTFWMVYLEGQRGPEYRHDNIEAARFEAERLARSFRKKAYVLRAAECVEVSDTKWSKTEDGTKHANDCRCYDCIPF